MTTLEEQKEVSITPSPSDAPSPLQSSEVRYHPLWQIVSTRVKEFYRHPVSIFWVYIFPVLMAIVLGVAFENPQSELCLVDIAEGQQAKSLAAALDAVHAKNAEITFKVNITSLAEARQRLKTGKTGLVVVPEKKADADAGKSTSEVAGIEYLYDPTRPESVAARRSVDDALQRAAGRVDRIAVTDIHFREQGGRYIDFVVPGLIGAGLMSGGMWGCGFIVVDLRVRQLLKRLITTPMRKTDFLIGLMISRLLFMVTEVILMFVAVSWMFNVQILGSWFALALIIGVGCFTFAGMGLVVASRVQTLETASGIINMVMLPMWLVSGIFFPSERFPEAFQPLIRILPLTALVDGVRRITIEAGGLVDILLPLTVLTIWTVVSFFLALKLFRWT